MIVNAKIQRKLEENRIKHEKMSIRTAIKSELVANKNAYELRINQLNEPGHENDQVLIPNKVIDGIYRTLLNKIGMLTEDEVEKILNAYLLMEEVPYNIRILAGTNNIVGYKDEIIMIREKKILEKVEKMHSTYLPKINDAIYSIENQLNS